jgi:hypothetical protein
MLLSSTDEILKTSNNPVTNPFAPITNNNDAPSTGTNINVGKFELSFKHLQCAV